MLKSKWTTCRKVGYRLMRHNGDNQQSFDDRAFLGGALMIRTYEFVYLPTDAGTIRLDIYYKHSMFHVQAELNGLVTSSYDRKKVEAVKKSLLLLAKEHHAF